MIFTATQARQSLERFHLRESMLASTGLASFMADMQSLLGVDVSLEQAHFEKRKGDMLEMYGYAPSPSANKPFAYSDGVAVIPVHGTLLNRFSCSWGFVTGYNFVRSQLNAALADPDVTLIVLDINSGGGEAVGCFELCDDLFKAREQKRLIAVVDASGLSAAFAIGSSCTKMYVTPSGWAGSIGVLSMHLDISGALKSQGVVPTIIADDPHKADGNPFEPLPEQVRQDLLAQVSKRYGEFIELVARNRGLDSQAIRDTQSRSFRADDALALGLIDGVLSPAQAVAEFLGELGSDDPDGTGNEDEENMATEAPKEVVTPAPVDHSAAVTSERERIKGIQTCEDAKGRETLAAHLAMETDMSVTSAQAILKASPKQVAAAPAPVEGEPVKAVVEANPFKDVMNKDVTHPNVGADGEEQNGVGEQKVVSRAQRAMLNRFGPRETASKAEARH